MFAVCGDEGRAARVAVRLVVLLLALVASPVLAQEPVPPPEPEDPVVVPIPPEEVVQDTLPRPDVAEPADTLRPAPNLPVFPRAAAAGFALGTWEWDQDALARWHGMSILDLLELVPGLLATRGGGFGRPTGLAAFGAGGGRVRVFIDGFELDPLESATLDVQHIAIADLVTVRVERTLLETRIQLFTFRQPDQRAFSQIEAGTAIFRTRILRGIFSTGVGNHSVVTVGLDLTDTEGWAAQQPFSANSLLGRWSYRLGDQTGLQLEYRQTGIERTGAPFVLQGDRRDLVFRARTVPLPGLALDAMAGRSSRTPGAADTLRVDLQSTQAALRARYDAAAAWVGAAGRTRLGDRVGFAAPALDLSAEAGLRPAPWFLATGEVRGARTAGITGTELQGGLRLGPAAGLSAFASVATGSRGIGLFADSVFEVTVPHPTNPDSLVLRSDTAFFFPSVASRATAYRAGAEWSGWGVRLGGAYLVHDVDSIAPFGLAFDRTLPAVPVGTATGFETYASIPLIYRPLRLEGSYTRWLDTGGRPYLPEDHGRFGLTFNAQFYGGNLEPTLRAEAVRRGSALVPTADRQAFGARSTPYTMFNIFLQIRVLDVRAFLIVENLLNNAQVADLVGPGRFYGGQRAIYGVRWHFFD
jgi:hypothetical protein